MACSVTDALTPGGDPGKTTRALQALLDRGGDIAVTEPGVYDIDDMLVIHGGTALRFGRGTVLRRVGGSDGALINRGALTGETDSDILVEGLRLCCNGFKTAGGAVAAGAAVPGMRGQLNFYRVKNLVLRDTACDDLPEISYFVHLSNWENVLIDTIRVTGLKDAVHLNRGEHLRLVNGRFRTFDDPVALNAHDYTTGCPEMGWIRDVVVENCADLSEETTTGFFARLLGGAWGDWQKGRMYRHSDSVVSSNGGVYRLIAKYDLTEYRSEVEPTHPEGDRTYPDGITWRLVQKDAARDCGCEHVVFRDILLQKKRHVAFCVQYENDGYCRSYYPGADAVPQRDILLDHVVCEAPIQVLVYGKTPVDGLRVVNSVLRAQTAVNLADPIYEERGDNRLSRVTLANNFIAPPEGERQVVALRAAPSRRAELTASGNALTSGFSLVTQGDVTEKSAETPLIHQEA